MVFDDLFADWGTVTTRILYRRCRELGLKVAPSGKAPTSWLAGFPVLETATEPAGEWTFFQLYRRYASRR